jgi:molecular chaperone DnaK
LRGDSGSVLIEVTQDEFEEKLSTFISRTELLVEQVLDEADSEPEDIDYILLVGGSTRIPVIQKSIKNLLGKEPTKAVNVDEAVALGAAIKAGVIMVKENPNNVSSTIAREVNNLNVVDVANSSYGTISLNYHQTLQREKLENSILIKKNTPLPCSETKTFYTVRAGQETVGIKITQGEDSDPDFIDIIHEEDMELPRGRPSDQPIEVTYSYDVNQLMKCVFNDINSGIVKEISIHVDISVNKKNTLDAFLVD